MEGINFEFEQKESERNYLNKLLSLIEKSPDISPIDIEKAPLKKWRENTKEVWQYVSPEEVEAYLQEKFFSWEYQSIKSTKEKVLRKNESDDYFTIPLNKFIYAAGFENWAGRKKEFDSKAWASFYGNGRMESLAVIKHYASLETEIPPVSFVNVYIQPNGIIFFDNDGGDSHRISAQLLRGEKNIKARILIVRKLTENFYNTENDDLL